MIYKEGICSPFQNSFTLKTDLLRSSEKTKSFWRFIQVLSYWNFRPPNRSLTRALSTVSATLGLWWTERWFGIIFCFVNAELFDNAYSYFYLKFIIQISGTRVSNVACKAIFFMYVAYSVVFLILHRYWQTYYNLRLSIKAVVEKKI